MSAVSRMSAPHAHFQHTAWCRDHENDPTPEEGWCRGDRMVIGGVETYLTGPTVGTWGGHPGIVVNKVDDPDELSPETVQILMARLKQLVKAAEAS